MNGGLPRAASRWAARANRLRTAFELSTPGLALTLSLLERIEELEHELSALQAQALRE